jgi:hypothetical protein
MMAKKNILGQLSNHTQWVCDARFEILRLRFTRRASALNEGIRAFETNERFRRGNGA